MAGSGGLSGVFVTAPCANGCGACGYVDEDVDGWGGGDLICIDGYSGATTTLGGDCDDTNPDLQQSLWVDDDHDGAGLQGTFGCFAAGENPPGYAQNGTDCDDGDPSFGPHVVDLVGDGIDRDCSGADGGPYCHLRDWAPVDVSAEAHCEGFDLRPVDVQTCIGDCRQRPFVRLANIGTQAVEGAIYVTSGEGKQVVLLEGLAANTLSEPFEIPYFEETFTLSTGEGIDCNPDNDTYAWPAPAGMRAFCSPK